MEKLHFPYSMKNIPHAGETEYLKQLVDKISKFQHNLGWRAYHFLNKTKKSSLKNFGFKSDNAPPFVEELKPFFDDIYDMVREIKFTNETNTLQKQLKADCKKIKDMKEVIVESDKTLLNHKIA